MPLVVIAEGTYPVRVVHVEQANGSAATAPPNVQLDVSFMAIDGSTGI